VAAGSIVVAAEVAPGLAEEGSAAAAGDAAVVAEGVAAADAGPM
jgi:hypothetical protein